ncbi:MAG: hypothetical protein JWO15_3651 [Sphingomonadales bacterium]|nr:hypothetical protein [Sphingomonadales bacterium]
MMWGKTIMAVLPAVSVGEIDPNILIPALFTVIGVVTASWFAYKGIKHKPNPSVANSDTLPKLVETTPLANFSGTYSDFARLIVEENSKQRDRIDSMEREFDQVKEELAAMKEELSKTQRNHTVFEDAVRRYLKVIAEYIEHVGGTMPHPETSDIPILDRTLPVHRHL